MEKKWRKIPGTGLEVEIKDPPLGTAQVWSRQGWGMTKRQNILAAGLNLVKRTAKFVVRKSRSMAEPFQYLLGKAYPKTSAFSPLLVFDTVVLPPSIWQAANTENEAVRYFLLWIISIVVGVTLLVYITLLVFKISALRSEPFLLEDKRLDLGRTEGEPAKVIDERQLSPKQP